VEYTLAFSQENHLIFKKHHLANLTVFLIPIGMRFRREHEAVSLIHLMSILAIFLPPDLLCLAFKKLGELILYVQQLLMLIWEVVHWVEKIVKLKVKSDILLALFK
jgi:hypothetical protein